MHYGLNSAEHRCNSVVFRLNYKIGTRVVSDIPARPVFTVNHNATRFAWSASCCVLFSVRSEVVQLDTLRMATVHPWDQCLDPLEIVTHMLLSFLHTGHLLHL